MTTLTNSSTDLVDLPSLGLSAAPGASIEVPDDTAGDLLATGWFTEQTERTPAPQENSAPTTTPAAADSGSTTQPATTTAPAETTAPSADSTTA